ncbi:hypothetical protein N7468_002260 [Penicillium chermesinum]|uniref:Uncharacterized protein n=1 Tax=Penicillium chermesinum TaxID=63820 RepID=A0A9W9PJJ5_9EURO|nr:uncharacterized protein N7468_002260 [Penicillium chermesinum]KAJ5247277.1 hypothetical protein N7468_002260 [Penicillium chermesinum]
MPSRVEVLAISALLCQALPGAIAAPGRIWGWDEDTGAPAGYGSLGGVDGDEGHPRFSDLASLEHSLEQGMANGGNSDAGFSRHGGPPVTVTISDCTTAPTATATVTITMQGSSYGIGTVTRTVTNTVTSKGPLATNTVTNTLTRTISQCAATPRPTAKIRTITADASTVTQMVSASVPTITSTVTDTQYTTTESYTETVTETLINTETKTVSVTSTVNAPESSNAPLTGTITNNINYGSCSDATINYATGLQGHTDYTYTTSNQADFPFGAALTIDSVEDFICTRLRSPCNAPQETIDRCYDAERAVAGHSGQEAARVWNELMG